LKRKLLKAYWAFFIDDAHDLHWLSGVNWQCGKPKTPIHDIVAPDAINLLAKRLITPLQICHCLTLALIKG
jgi:hypothetical protein